MIRFQPDKPYNNLPDLPPATELESRAVLKQCIEARAALAELKQAAAMLPNQAVLINTLPLLEAQASSEIENIITTTDKLFRYAGVADDQLDSATKEALRYRTALFEGYLSLRAKPLSTATAVRVCSTIKNREMDIRSIPGTTLRNDATQETIYTPPVGKTLLRDKLSNWERFLHGDDDLDPLVKMAIAHYQFEAIHPFLDGNGRTGRIINILYLIEQELLTIPVLYLSRYIIRRKADYYGLLLSVTRKQAWEAWILFMLEAVATTSRWTHRKIASVLALTEATRTELRERAPQIYSRELADLLFVQPYCRIGNLVDAGIAGRQTASVYLQKMVELGMLEEMKIGREKIFLYPRYLQVLSAEQVESG
jgi:Fic family protein